MSESQPQSSLSDQQQPQEKVDLPSRSTPSPDNGETEFKLSRKREREVSLEPATPTASNDTDPAVRARKHSGLPLKKNRRVLDSTEEENEADTSGGRGGSGSRSGSGSPPNDLSMLTSPRQELRRKVRQISQGVEDISWRGPEFASQSEPKDVEIEDATEPESAPVLEDAPIITSTETNSKPNGTQVELKNAPDEDTPPKTPDDLALSRSMEDVKHVDADVTMHASPDKKDESNEEHIQLLAASEADGKGLKRKFIERGASQGPTEGHVEGKTPLEPLKRPRDDADKDDNPRVAKKPSPPPSPPFSTSPSSPKIAKSNGFMAYASTSSPFSAVKGQNIFSSSKSASPAPSEPFTPTPAPSTPLVDQGPTFGESSSSNPNVVKRSGFDAFTSTSSPFSSFARAKSPVLGVTSKLGRAKSPPRSRGSPALASSAFASYAGSTHGFALHPQKRARATSPDGSGPSNIERSNPSKSVFGAETSSKSSSEDAEEKRDEKSFGERLRAAKDDEEEEEDPSKMQFTEQDVTTGEEEEETIHQVRGKLFSLNGNAWKERGTGLLRLNVKQDDGTGARLVMRKDAVYTLLLNITLFPGMRCSLAQDPRYLRFSAIENGVATTYNLKVSNAKIAQDLLEDINANIPS
ncbi:hypothetical protein CPB83DRAFT_858704 [Crepidotus variabilis]|uniref:RanBD1 domain-containing protein n=1 Tax=Crepidotus variabilis TaxID=179855 RepID=A0A9P6JMS9_9AGAR|nr:hypothetical protein CPB83DRAFT_858704 [Crepidotus variabilis]